MKRALVPLLIGVLVPAISFCQTGFHNAVDFQSVSSLPKAVPNYGELPLAFEANQGQTDKRVKFLSHGNGYTLFLTNHEAVFSLRQNVEAERLKITGRARKAGSDKAATDGVFQMKLVKANGTAKITGTDKLPGTSNYFIGTDPTKWLSRIPTYRKVKYRDVYPGVDLVYYGNQQQLEYDFVVAPGANPSMIRLKFEGASKLKINKDGNLLLMINGQQLRFRKPLVYQQSGGLRREIAGRYILKGRQITFTLARYDLSMPLIIDPILTYSTYLGGTGLENSLAIATDVAGNAYVAGYTTSVDFPSTTGAFQTALRGNQNAFVAKIDNSGSALVYCTYLGAGFEIPYGIAVDSTGNAYITGITTSTNFPTTSGAFQTSFSGGTFDSFVTKINATGSVLVYSTYLGGSNSDESQAIAVDSAGNAYVTGFTYSADFPTTIGAFQTSFNGNQAAFATEFNAAGSALVYSTYLGEGNQVSGQGIAVDSAGNAYVTGLTTFGNFPITPGAFQTTRHGSYNAFVTKINPAGSALVYSSYLGGSGLDFGIAIAVDSSGNAYVTGWTSSTDFPTVNPLQAANGGGFDAFIAKVNSTGTALIYSTYLGGSGDEKCQCGIALDSSGNAYVTGWTSSTNFPTVNPLQASNSGGYDAFVAEVSASGSALIYSTYLGGSADDGGNAIAVDSSGNAYVTGWTSSTNFPTVNPLQAANGGGGVDAFVAKMSTAPHYSICLLYDPTKPVHSGATIPIKLLLCDSNGNDVSLSRITLHALGVSQISTSISGAVEDSGSSDPNNDFRFDATLGTTGGYIYNLKTTGLSTGTYAVNFTVTGDTFIYAANFQVK